MEASGINIEFLSINSKAFDVSALTLGQFQEVVMSIPELESADIQWFTNNDPVLKMDVMPSASCKITAEAVGESTILVQDKEFNILKKIVFTVINQQAVALGLKAGSPELK